MPAPPMRPDNYEFDRSGFYGGPAQPLRFENLATGRTGIGEFTTPGQRPHTAQSALNYQVSVGTAPIPISPNQFEVDTFIVDVPSSTGNSVFIGYGSQVSVSSGIEVRPGLPFVANADSSREQWELQRLLELIYTAIKGESPGQYKAPRVVFDVSQYYLVAASTTTVAIMLFQPNDN